MMKKLIFIFGLLIFMLPLASSYGEKKGEILSPYFFVQSDDASLAPFPLLETKVEVNIAGVIAEIGLTQVYKNEGNRTIEAIYVFPLGIRSAIHAMRMKIGSRIVEAQIEERAMAKMIYERAKEEGKTASLLEQERPNVFQMKVANIMPGDVIEVMVNYTELLVPEKGIYEFVFPTVVGSRYCEKKEKETKDHDTWVKTPYLHEGQAPTYTFDIKVNIRTGISLGKVWVPSHKVKVRQHMDKAEINLSPEEEKGGNRDFILRYTLQGEMIQSGLLLYPWKKEKFFLLMLQPPEKVTLNAVPPREYVFIVDVSGSMHGFPLAVSKALIRKIVQKLRGKDYFNILFFAGGSNVLSPHPLPATEENKGKALAMLEEQRGGGGTRILPALKRALSLQKKEGLSRIIVIATDGYVAVEKEVFDLMRERLNEANFFAFGIGSSVNRYLIEGMARAGRGNPFVVCNKAEAPQVAERFSDYIRSPLLTDIEVELQGFDAYEVEPPSLPDLFARRPLVIFGKYKNAEGKMRVRGKTAWGTYNKRIEVSSLLEDEDNIALKYLWARERIARLSDYARVGAKVEEEVKGLGLRYHLMTQYTSFVAVDTVVRDTGEVVTVKQPLPLPEGVSDYAVGNHRGKVAAPLSSGFVKTLAAKEAGYYPPQEEKRELSRICIMGGKLPPGITMEEVENILSPLKDDLKRVFKKWGLKKVVVLLKIEGGKTRSIQVKNYHGKAYKKEVLEKILQKIVFSPSIKGTMELELIYV
ncbi:MAG: VWA domain-containing protein [Deltaproteobacteria bacterium]|nr:VWA domain-containing protein [Deltaproteobacteria bacterium]